MWNSYMLQYVTGEYSIDLSKENASYNMVEPGPSEATNPLSEGYAQGSSGIVTVTEVNPSLEAAFCWNLGSATGHTEQRGLNNYRTCRGAFGYFQYNS